MRVLYWLGLAPQVRVEATTTRSCLLADARWSGIRNQNGGAHAHLFYRRGARILCILTEVLSLFEVFISFVYGKQAI